MAKKIKKPVSISNAKLGLIGVISGAVLGLCGTVIVAYIGYLGTRVQIEEPIHATSTAEAKLTQLANAANPTSSTVITETITPTKLQFSATQTVEADQFFATQTAEAYPSVLLTQAVGNPDLNPDLLKFPLISIQDTPLNKDGFFYGWKALDPAFQDLSMFRAAGSAEKFWSRNSTVVDPPFDIVILNTTDEPIFVTQVGIEIVKVSNIIRGGGGGFPFSEKVEIQDEYEIILPDINAMQEGAGLFEYDDLILNEVVSIKLSNPIYMQPQAPYRFILTLRDYQVKMPTDVFIRFWVETNKGEARSRIFFLNTHK